MKFSQALDRKLEEIKRPPNPPVGHYVWQVSKHPEVTDFESQDGKSFERVTFQITAVAPGDDVDPDELKEYGKIDGYISEKTFLFIDSEEDPAGYERSMFNLKRFLGHCGVDESLELGEALAASVGQRFLGELNHQPDKNDPEVVYARVGRTSEE